MYSNFRNDVSRVTQRYGTIAAHTRRRASVLVVFLAFNVDPGQETKAKMVWPCLKVFWFSKDNPTGHSERKKKKRQTEEEVGRQYQRVDRNVQFCRFDKADVQ